MIRSMNWRHFDDETQYIKILVEYPVAHCDSFFNRMMSDGNTIRIRMPRVLMNRLNRGIGAPELEKLSWRATFPDNH